MDWMKDIDDERGKWVYGSSGWIVYRWAGEGYRIYSPSKVMTPALTLAAAKAFVEMHCTDEL